MKVTVHECEEIVRVDTVRASSTSVRDDIVPDAKRAYVALCSEWDAEDFR